MRVARGASTPRFGPPRDNTRGGWPIGAKRSWLGCSWLHSRPAFSPYTRSLSPFSLPGATWLPHSMPRAPFSNRSSMCTLSSSLRPGTNRLRSAASSRTASPVTKPARLCACVPMSPRQPPSPARAGSTRHSACFCPVSSSLVVSQSCTYSTCTTRIVPSSPAATISRARRPPCRAAAAGPSSGDAEHAAVRGLVGAGAREIVERLLGHPDDVLGDELRPFAGAILGMLEAALPLEHRPAGIVVLRELRED